MLVGRRGAIGRASRMVAVLVERGLVLIVHIMRTRRRGVLAVHARRYTSG